MSKVEPTPSVVTEVPQAIKAPPVTAVKTAAQLELLDGDEIIQLSIKPSLWYIALVSAGWLFAVGVLVVVLAIGMQPTWTREGLIAIQVLIGVAALRVGVAMLQWASRLYVLTNRRVMRFKGVFNVDVLERRLVQISAVDLHVRWCDRALRLGSIHMPTAEDPRPPVIWDDVARPHEIHEILERAIRKAQSKDQSP